MIRISKLFHVQGVRYKYSVISQQSICQHSIGYILFTQLVLAVQASGNNLLLYATCSGGTAFTQQPPLALRN